MKGSLAFNLGEKKPSGEKALNLGPGEPFLCDFPINDSQSIMERPGVFHYGGPKGDEELKSLLVKRYYGQLNTNNIILTHGAIGGIDLIFRRFLKKNQEVLLPDPGFPPYTALAKEVQAQITYYKYDENLWDTLSEKCTDKTKFIVLNSPHNPTGEIIDPLGLPKFRSLLEKFPNLSFIYDEVYREIIFAKKHLDLQPFIHRGFLVGSVSKLFPLQGARIGWVASSRAKIADLADLVFNTMGSVSSFGVELAKLFFRKNQTLTQAYAENRDMAISLLKSEKIEMRNQDGTFYLFLNTKNVLGSDCAKALLNLGVIVIPGEVFGENAQNYIRCSMGQKKDILREGLTIICDTIHQMNS